MSRNLARLITALADRRAFSDTHAGTVWELHPHLAMQRKRHDWKVMELADRANIPWDELGDLDAQVKRELLRRRDSERRHRTHEFSDAFAQMLSAAGIRA